jgi:hypothetical protein
LAAAVLTSLSSYRASLGVDRPQLLGVEAGSVGHAYNIRDIEISGNRIVDPPGVAIKLVNADGVLVRNNTIINPLSGLDRQETLDFSKGIPCNELTEVMRYPYYGIVTISTRNVRGSGNCAEDTRPAWRGMLGVGAWSEHIAVE